MKKINKLAILATMTFLAASCSQNDEPMAQTDHFPADGVIRVAANVNKPQTRAGMTSDNLTDFYMYLENTSELTGKYNYFVKMKNDGGVWKSYNPQSDSEISQGIPASEKVMLWQNKMNSVTVTAFRTSLNWVESTLNSEKTISVRVDQDKKENVEASDMLYMGKTFINPGTDLTPDGKMKVQLDHRLSKLNITLNLATEFNLAAGGTTNNPITEVKLSGFNNTAKWNPLTDQLQNYGDSRAFLLPFMANYSPGEAETKQAVAKYECILLPQTIENTPTSPEDVDFQFSVRIKIGGKTYTWSQPTGKALLFYRNTQYNLTLNVGKEVVTLGGFSIMPWGDGGSYDVDTE